MNFDKHQATNEWGAIKLLLNYGISLKKIEESYKIPKTIFFKQKLIEHGISDSSIIDFNGYLLKAELIKEKEVFKKNVKHINNILLVDDNFDKGWDNALRQMFNPVNIDVKSDFESCKAIGDFSKYDFIFLDLRLPLNSSSNNLDPENGLKLISIIKNNDKFLNIPLIVFTASQKASTLHKILEVGADAMYVKESFEYSHIDSYDNFYDFISKVNFQIKKSLHLKKYWEAIIKIKNSFRVEIKDTPLLLLKSRIIERLEMFYGLIKQSYEQSTYNSKKFHYSSDILSFMTLWSILNEIQECYFDKNIGTSYIKIKDFSTTPSTFSNLKLDDWKLKNQSPDKFYVVEKPIFEESVSNRGTRVRPDLNKIRRDQYSDFKTKKTSPYYEFDSEFKIRRVDYKEKLSLQIAFILLAKNSFNRSSKINNYLSILKKSNDQRNSLYITHGENLNTGFHSSLEKNKTIASNASFDLFSLISFLLTGNDSIV